MCSKVLLHNFNVELLSLFFFKLYCFHFFQDKPVRLVSLTLSTMPATTSWCVPRHS